MDIQKITVGVGLDLQDVYDNLIVYKNSIDAQIKSLGDNPSICTHVKTEGINGVTVCSNKDCGKVISTNGLYDYVVTK